MIYLGRDQVGLNQLMSTSSGSTLPSLVFNLDPMPNTTGSYTHTTSIQDVTSTMKPIMIEYSNPSAFLDNVTVTCDNGSITLSCPNVSGSSDISVTVTDLSSSSQTTVFPVEDVQINGTSIVNNGVANIPFATTSSPGVFMRGPGLYISNGTLGVNTSDDSNIKSGTTGTFTSVGKQHLATFYGLAKVAGHDEKNSSLNAGQYSPEAKIAIQKMLGIYDPPFELLQSVTLDQRTSVDYTTDSNGTPLNLISVFMEVLYPANLTTEPSGYGRWQFYDIDNNYLVAETGRFVTNSNTSSKNVKVEFKGGYGFCTFTRQATVGNYVTWVSKCMQNRGAVQMGNIVRIRMHNEDYEPAGAQIKIYGQRAYM